MAVNLHRKENTFMKIKTKVKAGASTGDVHVGNGG
jgi:hypothetical protein